MKTMLAGNILWACMAAAADGPSQFPETEWMKSSPRAVFVAAMGNYRTTAISGDWGSWNHRGEGGKRHVPESMGPGGRRDIAAPFYPAIGPYDMSDREVAEYHCQLLKMAGVDGVSFNLSFYERDPWRQKSMKMYVEMLRRYGLKGLVRFENKFFARHYTDPREALAASYRDMDAWLSLMEPVQWRIGGRPVFMLFTFKLSSDELRAWKEKYPPQNRPFIVVYSPQPDYRGVVDGFFGWTGDKNRRADHPPYVRYVDTPLVRANEQWDRERADRLLRDGLISFYMGGVSPGFDDIGCWGWGDGPRKVERAGGETYRYRWEQLLRTNLRTVFIPTWNDWAEGTIIEPAVEFGNQYLEMTREYGARFKGVAAPAGDLRTPLWIYKVRKTAADAAALREMRKASDLIAQGKFREAGAVAERWARKLGLTEYAVWGPR